MTTRNAGTGTERPASTGALGFGAEAARGPGSEVAPGRGSIYTESELRTLIERGEGQFLEFKSAWDRSGGQRKPLARRVLRDRIAEVVAAFANADGGVLLVGVEDDGRPSGHGYPEAAVDTMLTVPRIRLGPGVSCRPARRKLGEHEVLVFETLMAPEAIMVEGHGFPCRFGEQTVRASQETINARKQEARQVAYERRLDSEATREALDPELVRRFIERTPLSGRSGTEGLEYYGFIQRDQRGWQVTNAALLLFGRRDGFRWHPRADIRLFRVAGPAERHGLQWSARVIEVIRPPVLVALTEAGRIISAQVRRPQGSREHRCHGGEIPASAWEEALLNSVAHRDYDDQHRGVEVWFYDDRVEFRSPGGVVLPATEKALREGEGIHACRNPMLVRALTDARYMRDEGEGMARIRDEMEANSLPPPEIAVERGLFVIRLFNGTGGGES